MIRIQPLINGIARKVGKKKDKKKVEVKDRMGLRSHSLQFHEKKILIY